jgi:membrane protease YdiL (CAAX protease family)
MMRIFNIVRWTIFYLTIFFFFLLFVGLVSFSVFSLEFKSKTFGSTLYLYLLFLIPISIILTLAGTLNKKNTNNRNWVIGGLTILLVVATFLIMGSLLMHLTFGGWTNETILYRAKHNSNVSINEQIWGVGALGYNRNRTRIVKLKPVLKYLYQVTLVDTGRLEKAEWIFVNEEGDIH